MNKYEKIVTAAEVRRKTLFSLLALIAFFVICVVAWKWLHRQPKEQGALKPLRSAMYANESLFRGMFSNYRLAKTYPKEMAVKKVRVNGKAGMSDDFNAGDWQLRVIRSAGDTLALTLDDIKKLPKTEITFDFKCIEGWSQITHWGGVRFSDFIDKYGLDAQANLQYTGLITPDEGYYVGIDSESMLHPQTILCYEVNGKPLPMNQGYPLRLIIPVKYGVKHIKRIGTIFFSEQRPPDYWHERGYDYYCGL